MTGWQDWRMSDPVTWTVKHYPRGCWKCRLRARLRWPRPLRHFNCGPAEPGATRLRDLP